MYQKTHKLNRSILKFVLTAMIFAVVTLSLISTQTAKAKTENSVISLAADTYTYTITYYLDNGINHAENPSGHNGKDYFSLKSPTKEYHTFSGWFTDSAFMTGIYSISKTSGNISVYAKFEPKTFKVTYEMNGGNHIFSDLSVPIKEKVFGTNVSTGQAEKVGYNFDGYYLTPNFAGSTITTLNDSYFTTTEEIKLYAKFVIRTHIITILGQTQTSATVNYGDTVGSILKPSKQYYDFAYFAKDATGNNKFSDSYVITSDMTIYPIFTPKKYTISYDYGAGTLPIGQTNKPIFTIETSEFALILPIKNGFNCLGFTIATESNANIFTIFSIARLTSIQNLTLTAYYEGRKFNAKYINADGQTMHIDSVKENTLFTLRQPGAAPIGKEFKGWRCNGQFYTDKLMMQSADIELIEVFYYKNFTISYITEVGVANDARNPQNYNYATDVISLYSAIKNGYNFLYWTDVNDQVVRTINPTNMENYVLTANFEIADFTFKFHTNWNEWSIEDVSAKFETSVTEPEKPDEREGYTFDGWYSFIGLVGEKFVFNKMPHDVPNLYAKWIRIEYKMTFHSNKGSEIPSITQGYDTYLETEIFPVRKGFIFKGWYFNENLSGTMYDMRRIPLGDCDLYAKWEFKNPKLKISSDQTNNSVNAGSPLKIMLGYTIEAEGYQIAFDWYTVDGSTKTPLDKDFDNFVIRKVDESAVYGCTVTIQVDGETYTFDADPMKMTIMDIPVNFQWWWLAVGAGILVVISFVVEKLRKF